MEAKNYILSIAFHGQVIQPSHKQVFPHRFHPITFGFIQSRINEVELSKMSYEPVGRKEMHIELAQLSKFKYGFNFYFSSVLYCWSPYTAKYILFVLIFETLLETIPQWLDALWIHS